MFFSLIFVLKSVKENSEGTSATTKNKRQSRFLLYYSNYNKLNVTRRFLPKNYFMRGNIQEQQEHLWQEHQTHEEKPGEPNRTSKNGKKKKLLAHFVAVSDS